MFRNLILALVFSFGATAQANLNVQELSLQIASDIAVQTQLTNNLGWTVGDTADYNLKGGILNGTMKSLVRELISDGFWVEQNVTTSFGNQKIEILFDQNTGQVKKILANGQEQDLPDASNIEIVDQKEAQVTVPAGTFPTVYIKIRDKSNNQEQEAWLNRRDVPISGMVKSISQSQMGPITLELVSFNKQN